MATVDELCRDVVGSLGLSESYLICAKWVDNRYKEMVSKVRFRRLRRIGEVQVPAVYDTGTIAVTRDDTAVTGTGTSWLTPIPTIADAPKYWWLKSRAWYKLSSLTDDTNLVLATNFSEDTVTAGSYTLVKRYHSLDSSARWLGDFVLTRLRLPLGNGGMLVPLEQLDREAPGRVLTAQYPRTGAVIGVDSNSYIMVEFYPYCAKSEIIHYVYWDLPTELTISSNIPTQIDAHMLKEGILIDAYRYLKAKARQSAQADIANSWRNDEFAQRTVWKNYIADAIRSDKSTDDTSFILSMYGNRTSGGDIVSARDHILSNWSYPT